MYKLTEKKANKKKQKLNLNKSQKIVEKKNINF